MTRWLVETKSLSEEIDAPTALEAFWILKGYPPGLFGLVVTAQPIGSPEADQVGPRSPHTGGLHEWRVITWVGGRAVACLYCGAMTVYFAWR